MYQEDTVSRKSRNTSLRDYNSCMHAKPGVVMMTCNAHLGMHGVLMIRKQIAHSLSSDKIQTMPKSKEFLWFHQLSMGWRKSMNPQNPRNSQSKCLPGELGKNPDEANHLLFTIFMLHALQRTTGGNDFF